MLSGITLQRYLLYKRQFFYLMRSDDEFLLVGNVLLQFKLKDGIYGTGNRKKNELPYI